MTLLIKITLYIRQITNKDLLYSTRNSTQYSVITYIRKGASLVAQMVKNLPVMQKTLVQFLGWEDTLEKGMETHSVFLPGDVPWTEESGRIYSPWGSKQSDTTGQLSTARHTCEKRILKRVNMCVCITESLCCTFETNTTL